MEHDYFSHLTGNNHIKSYLTRCFQKNRVANSLLFCGPEPRGMFLFAVAFAKMLLKTKNEYHPDLHVYRPEGKSAMHSIDSMRKFSEQVYLSPYASEKKVFIIDDAERMLPTGANALLKTFEEPSKESVIILITHKPEICLPTILSRCQTVRFHRFGKEEAKLNDPAVEHLLKFLAEGSFENYTNLMQFAKALSDDIDQEKKLLEEQLHGEMIGTFNEKPAAARLELIQKEVDGAVSVQTKEKVARLFNTILSWYRDMHLLNVNGNPQYLMLPDYKKHIMQMLQRGALVPLETLQILIKDAMVAFDRSTPLAHCMESLFLQLQKF